MSCISISSLLVLINEERLNYFLSSRGIRQGDPLSLYIFILCMEYLASLILYVVNAHSWPGIRISRDGPTFSHLFFADDLILFAKATKRNYHTIKNTINNFCSLSRQKINFSKSRIFFSPHTSPNSINATERELGMRACNDFENYLGVPILTSKRNTKAFNFLIDKLRSKLANWKASALSLVGRLTLITAVTTAIPTHVMHNTMLPSKVFKEINKFNKKFLWRHSTTKRNIHLMNWSFVTLPKAVGGLGIKTSIHRNKALLAKCLCDIWTHSKSLHALMFRKKYCYLAPPPLLPSLPLNVLPPLWLVSIKPRTFVIMVQGGWSVMITSLVSDMTTGQVTDLLEVLFMDLSTGTVTP